MLRLRRLAARLRRAAVTADAIAGCGIVLLTIGFGLAWVPAGFIVAGGAMVIVARYGTEAG